MQRLNSGRFQNKPSASASNNGRINVANVCVHRDPSLKVIRERIAICRTITAQYYHSGNFMTAHHISSSFHLCLGPSSWLASSDFLYAF
jgi:hypothetical protein